MRARTPRPASLAIIQHLLDDEVRSMGTCPHDSAALPFLLELQIPAALYT